MLRSKFNNVHASDARRPAWVRQQTDQTHLMCSLSGRVPHGRIARETWNLSGCPWRSLTGWLIPWSVLRPPTPSCPCPPSASPHSVCITRPKQRWRTPPAPSGSRPVTSSPPATVCPLTPATSTGPSRHGLPRPGYVPSPYTWDPPYLRVAAGRPGRPPPRRHADPATQQDRRNDGDLHPHPVRSHPDRPAPPRGPARSARLSNCCTLLLYFAPTHHNGPHPGSGEGR